MKSEHVLGYLAQRFSVSEENIATEALTWILRRSNAARRSVSRFVRTAEVDLPDDLNYIGQVGHPETGRPDIVGIDENGRERLLIEAKFGAALTENQPAGYLKRLPSGVPAVLLVVAPSVRVAPLWVELLNAVPSLAGRAPSPSAAAPNGLLAVRVSEHHVLALVSWRDLATVVLDSLRSSGELGLVQDAEQLIALTEVMDSSAFAAARPGDYGARMARLIRQLEPLVDDTWRMVCKGALLERNGNASHGRIFYGWYLRVRAVKKSLWFGYLPRAWDRHGQSPLWVQMKTSES